MLLNVQVLQLNCGQNTFWKYFPMFNSWTISFSFTFQGICIEQSFVWKNCPLNIQRTKNGHKNTKRQQISAMDCFITGRVEVLRVT